MRVCLICRLDHRMQQGAGCEIALVVNTGSIYVKGWNFGILDEPIMKYKVSVRNATGRKLEVGKQWNNEPAFGRSGDEHRIMKWGRTLDCGFGE